MLRLGRHASLLCALALLASCSSLLGLDDLEPDDLDAGAAGRVIEPMTGGSKNDGGSSGKDGEGGEGADGPKGEGGESSGGAPSGGNAGSAGSAGNGGSSGSAGSAGDGGSGGIVIPDDCPEITLTYNTAENDLVEENSVFEFSVSPDIAGSGPDIVQVEFYWYSGLDGDATGTFQIEGSDDTQYATCARCVRIIDQLQRDYLAVTGTVVIDEASQQNYGYPQAVVTDLTLIEVTINADTYISAPVANGACFHLASVTLDKPPVGWDCDDDPTGGSDLGYYQDGDCDCGCGIVDVDCASAAGTECEENRCISGSPDPADNSQCL
jgi:hypothetical protein